MNEQSRYKQDKTKTRQSINVKSHIFNIKGDNDKSKQTPTRMSSVREETLEMRRLIRSEKERLEVQRNFRSRKTIRSETTTRREKKRFKEVREPSKEFETRLNAICEDQGLYVRGLLEVMDCKSID
ncbi:hypothetical protein Tco_1482943 [Tanacetum coccineum]